MKLNHIMAVFKKTLKDMLRNKRQLLLFLIFPIMAHLFGLIIEEGKELFPLTFLPMNVMFCSINIMAAVISEEKEKGTLRCLMFANVKPLEYFLGNAIFVLLVTAISSCLFIPLINISGIEYLYFFGFMILSSICSMVLGATIGISVKNQMAANGLCAPVTIIIGMLPTFGAMNESLKGISKLLYSTRFADTVSEIITKKPISLDYGIFLTYIINFIICLVIFSIVYKKKKLDD